jgi:AraC family transcriptional regulator, positive regulator of tynA and feaB
MSMENHMQSLSNQALLNQALSTGLVGGRKGLRLSTADIEARERRDWLQEMICQEYTRVEVTPPSDGNLFNETTFYAWDNLRLSVIQSNGLTIERLPREPYKDSQDNYLAVVLLSGNYLLEQNGREVFLQPGDMTLYDATRPHRIQSSSGFSKLLVSIPRSVMRDRVAGVEHCTAMQVSGKSGIGAITTHFIQSAASQAENMNATAFSELSEPSLDLLTLALNSVRPQGVNLSRSRSISLRIVKDFVEHCLSDSMLDTAMISAGTHLSARYINDLFKDEGQSLMRYVWGRRLEKCHKEIMSINRHPISHIAFRWGFNDLSHFSRAFKRRFGVCPTLLKQSCLPQVN